MYLCQTTLRHRLFNTHNERALAYLLGHIQPVYNYSTLRLFPDPGFSVCVNLNFNADSNYAHDKSVRLEFGSLSNLYKQLWVVEQSQDVEQSLAAVVPLSVVD